MNQLLAGYLFCKNKILRNDFYISNLLLLIVKEKDCFHDFYFLELNDGAIFRRICQKVLEIYREDV